MKTQIFDFEGKTFMTSRAASDRWDLTMNEVRDACIAGKCPGAFKDSSKKWCIPVDCVKPYSDAEIKAILTVSVILKNDSRLAPNIVFSEKERIKARNDYEYLMLTDYIQETEIIDESLFLRSALLTKKGLELILKPNRQKDFNIAETIKDWGPTALKFAVVLIEMLK